MCFFGSDSLLIRADVQKFIEYKKSSLKARMDAVIKKVVTQGLGVGDTKLEVDDKGRHNTASERTDIQSQLLQEIREKLFGRNITARGSILSVHDELWFFPNKLQFS
jgi:hypothetical protein